MSAFTRNVMRVAALRRGVHLRTHSLLNNGTQNINNNTFVASSSSSSFSTTATQIPAPLYITSSETAKIISPWHDIPLRPTSDPAIFNFVCEIPKGLVPPKLEIDTGKPHNPIVQDKTKDGKPRFYKLDSLIHYGALPQTYENPNHKDKWTGQLGDGDPIDVCDIAVGQLAKPGQVYTVKVLGALAMLDGGETDWKLLAVRTDDPLAATANDIATAPDNIKRLADSVREWFRTYKIPEGKGENSFAFDGKWLDRDTALEIIQSTHEQWLEVMKVRSKAEQAKKGPWLPPSTGWTSPAQGYLQSKVRGSALLQTGTTTKLA